MKVSNKVRLSGLWKNETKDGIKYLGGSNEGRRFSVFTNGFREKDTDPDYILYEMAVDGGVPDDILGE